MGSWYFTAPGTRKATTFSTSFHMLGVPLSQLPFMRYGHIHQSQNGASLCGSCPIFLPGVYPQQEGTWTSIVQNKSCTRYISSPPSSLHVNTCFTLTLNFPTPHLAIYIYMNMYIHIYIYLSPYIYIYTCERGCCCAVFKDFRG